MATKTKKNLSTKAIAGQAEEEILVYRQRLQTNPRSLSFFPLAKALYQMKRFSEAVAICHQGLLEHNNYSAAKVVLAQAYMAQSMHDKALIQLEAVIKDVPNNMLANKLLAQIYIKQGRMEKVIDRYQHILNHHPECSDLKKEIERIKTSNKLKYKKIIRGLEGWLKQIKAYRTEAA